MKKSHIILDEEQMHGVLSFWLQNQQGVTDETVGRITVSGEPGNYEFLLTIEGGG